jgi:hypothetical protein
VGFPAAAKKWSTVGLIFYNNPFPADPESAGLDTNPQRPFQERRILDCFLKFSDVLRRVLLQLILRFNVCVGYGMAREIVIFPYINHVV